MYSVTKNQSQPTKNYWLWEKTSPNATFNLFFLGLGWPWVGEFVGFITIFYMLSDPTEFSTIANTLLPVRMVRIARHSVSFSSPLFSTCYVVCVVLSFLLRTGPQV